MNGSKLPQAIASFLLSATGGIYSWVEHHGNAIVLAISALAGIYSLYATYLTVKVKLMEKQHLKNIDPGL